MQVEGLNYRVAAYCYDGRQAQSRSNRTSASKDRALALHFDLNTFEFRRQRLDGLTFGTEGDFNAVLGQINAYADWQIGPGRGKRAGQCPPCEYGDISRNCPVFKQAAQAMRHLPESGL